METLSLRQTKNLLIGIAVQFCTQHAAATTLIEAIESANGTNPVIAAAREDFEAFSNGVGEARSAFFPEVTVDGSYTLDRTKTMRPAATAENSPFGFETPELDLDLKSATYATSLLVTQPVFEGGRNWNRLGRSKAAARAAKANIRDTEQVIFLQVATSFFDIYRDRAVLDALQESALVLGQEFENTSLRFELGEVTSATVAQAEARRSRAQSDIISAQRNVVNSVRALERVAGVVSGEVEIPNLVPELPKDLDVAIAFARAKHPKVISARQNIILSEKGIAIEKAEIFPNISVEWYLLPVPCNRNILQVPMSWAESCPDYRCRPEN